MTFIDRIAETSTTTGTGTLTLAGAIGGYQSFAAVGNGGVTYYAITDNAGNWEVGSGTYTSSGTTLSRSSVLASSNSGAAVNFGAGTKTVYQPEPASWLNSVITSSGSYSDPSWITSLAGSKVSGNIGGNAANVTGTVAIGHGGTGQTTASTAINALLPTQTANSGKFLATDGSSASWAAVVPPVTSVSCGDGSLTVSPTTANVIAQINLSKTNTWVAEQNFADVQITGTTTLRGVTYTWPSADGGAGTVLATDSAGSLSWAAGPPATAGGSDGEVQYNSSGTLAGFGSYDPATGTFIVPGHVGINTTTVGTAISGANTLLHAHAAGSATGACVFLENENFYTAFVGKGSSEADMILQSTAATAGQQAFYFRVTGGNFDIINLNDTLTGINNYCYSTRYDGRMSMGFGSGNPSTFLATLSVGANGDATNTPVKAIGTTSQTGDLLQCCDVTPTVQFAVGSGGQLKTNQTAAGSTLGTVVGSMPVYDAAGTLVGLLPLYDTIT